MRDHRASILRYIEAKRKVCQEAFDDGVATLPMTERNVERLTRVNAQCEMLRGLAEDITMGRDLEVAP